MKPAGSLISTLPSPTIHLRKRREQANRSRAGDEAAALNPSDWPHEGIAGPIRRVVMTRVSP